MGILAHDWPDGNSFDELDDGFFDDDPFDATEGVAGDSYSPSLPVILFSAISGVAGATIGLYMSTVWLGLGVELSAGVATLAMLLSLGLSGSVLTALTGSRAAPLNILFSCGLVFILLLFLALCLLVGAIGGTLLLT